MLQIIAIDVTMFLGTAPITKKQRKSAKGMTPIAKNIRVVDNFGKEYEATYLKRAKGLVKNGRARFIDENTICLVCPPEIELEDNDMSENKQTKKSVETVPAIPESEKQLTSREIFDKISELQEQLTKNSYHSLHRLDDSVTQVCSAEENTERQEQITEICSVFKTREATLLKMLQLYERMYADLNDDNSKKVALIKGAFSEHAETIRISDLPSEDKHAEFSDITEKITELIQKLLIPSATPTTKQTLIAELTRTLRAQGVSAEEKERAKEILKSYVETPF